MKRHFKYFFAAMMLGMAFTSCSDVDDRQELSLSRVLSPTGITSRVSGQTNIVVSWNAMDGATGYEVEAYADSPDYDQRTPDAQLNTSATEATFTNLVGETEYYIRVRAIDSLDQSRNSSWVETVRTTNPEQNMRRVASGDIQSTAVTLRWTAGIQADQVVCTPTDANTTAEAVTYTLTEDDIAAGSATIDGLEPETNYRAALLLGEKTRGYATFTTNLDLRDAIQLSPTDDWVTAIENAAAGSKFALAPGTYTMTGDSKLQINSDVTIGAQSSANRPVLNACLHLNNGASLTLYQLVMDGEGTDGSQTVEYKTEGGFGSLTIKGCEVKNYTKGLIYINVAAVPNAITIDNCVIHDIECNGGDFIDSRRGGWNSLTLTNSTIYSSAASRDVLRCDDASSSVSATMQTTIDHCTFHNVGNGGANYRFFYLRFPGNQNTFTNNIVSGFVNRRGFANSSAVGVPTYSNNYYYACENLTSLAEGNSQTGVTCFDTSGTVLSATPFAAAESADFALTDETLSSSDAGDPRWQ